MNKPWIFLAVAAIIGLAGCDSRYRYPCQDPNNWESKECKKPWCSADGTCPEDLQHYEKNVTAAPKQVELKKGECK